MDPQRPSKTKDGKWDFPEGVSFPVDARVMIKFFKVAETVCDGEGRGQTKYLNTKVVKAEASFSKEDLFCKASVLEAIERDCEVKNLAEEESIKNPKIELSIKRQDSGEVFTVIKMGFVVKRLEKLKDRSDTILIEVKEQIISFQPNKPTIRITVNAVPQETSVSGREFPKNVVLSLNSALRELDNKELKKIVCGKCLNGFKTRDAGGSKTLVSYYKEHHFKSCGNKEKKRKAEEEAEEKQKLKKEKEVEKMDKYWSNLRSKDQSVNDDEGDDFDFDDPDLNIEQNDVEVFSQPGSSSSISG